MVLITEIRGKKKPRKPTQVVADLRMAAYSMQSRLANPYELLREAADLIEDLSKK